MIRGGINGEYKLVTSLEILDEVVDRLRNKFGLPEEKIEELVKILFSYSQIIETKSKLDVVRDKKDNKIIECAFDGKVDHIVTGDPDLLILKEFRGIKIVKAKEFLDEFQ